jgi:precorrin-2/cobalt-factor-2 C20-methyltransferase
VALGPGDPELITVKGLKRLKEAQKIYYPGSVSASGQSASYALDILNGYDLNPDTLRGMTIPMNKNRARAAQAYDKYFELIRADYEAGLNVVICAEGDISFYSTFGYLLEKCQNNQLPVKLIAGVPAFIAAGAEAQLALASQKDSVAIFSQLDSFKDIQTDLERFETIVVMKLSTVREELIPFLETAQRAFVYAEKIGSPDAFFTSQLDVLKHRQIPYLSLLILLSP